MDPIVASVLVKGVDFLFDEGRKILQWRRDHLGETATAGTPGRSSTSEMTTETPAPEVEALPRVATAKDELLRERVDEAILARMQGEIEHLVTLMDIHTRNFRNAEKQLAAWGDALAPPIILHNLETEGLAVETTMRRLRAAVSEVYGTKVVIPELEASI